MIGVTELVVVHFLERDEQNRVMSQESSRQIIRYTLANIHLLGNYNQSGRVRHSLLRR